MLWDPYNRMSNTELPAIFKYLQNLDPVTADEPIPLSFQAGPAQEGI